MKKMASSDDNFQGPYVLGHLGGVQEFPLGLWLPWTTGQASVGESAPETSPPWKLSTVRGEQEPSTDSGEVISRWVQTPLPAFRPLSSSTAPSHYVYSLSWLIFCQLTMRAPPPERRSHQSGSKAGQAVVLPSASRKACLQQPPSFIHFRFNKYLQSLLWGSLQPFGTDRRGRSMTTQGSGSQPIRISRGSF